MNSKEMETDLKAAKGKRKRTRRRARNVKEWKRVKAKTARLSGDAYKTAKGKETQKKQLKAYKHTHLQIQLQQNF
nr:unnamed protein product [Callosobruchus chinensis]